MLQELAGVRGGKPAAKSNPAKPAAKDAAKAAAGGNGNGHAAATKMPKIDFKIGARVKYNDGSAWIPGVVESVEPAVLLLEDETEIRTNLEVLQAGAAEGLIVGA